VPAPKAAAAANTSFENFKDMLPVVVLIGHVLLVKTGGKDM
jgi:hypothetical protein